MKPNTGEGRYLELLRDVMLNGSISENRTDTPTRKVFGRFWSCDDVVEDFPLLTTKRVHFKSVVAELIWFLSGSTNEDDLSALGCTIWQEWRGQGGEMGPVYGDRWRRWGKPRAIVQPTPRLRDGLVPNFLSIGRGGAGPLYRRWANMMARCYDRSDKDFPRYGARGVFVDDRWLEFDRYCADVPNLPGYAPGRELDKDANGFGFCYSPEHCIWLTPEENGTLRYAGVSWVFRSPDGVDVQTSQLKTLAEEHGLDSGSLSRVASGKFAHHKGWTFVRKDTGHVDQISEAVRLLNEEPNSRRIIVTAWDPQWSPYAALPPCHTHFQLQTQDGDLNMMVNMRSIDIFLGMPFNIASYALLLTMFAHVTGYRAKRLTLSLGDLHIYDDHMEQARIQLSRNQLDAPRVGLEDSIGSIFDFRSEHVELRSYNPHSGLKGKVAV